MHEAAAKLRGLFVLAAVMHPCSVLEIPVKIALECFHEAPFCRVATFRYCQQRYSCLPWDVLASQDPHHVAKTLGDSCLRRDLPWRWQSCCVLPYRRFHGTAAITSLRTSSGAPLPYDPPATLASMFTKPQTSSRTSHCVRLACQVLCWLTSPGQVRRWAA
ncbi:hypothetical protein TPAR_08565, partial [Tolypocladium paradoxum]